MGSETGVVGMNGEVVGAPAMGMLSEVQEAMDFLSGYLCSEEGPEGGKIPRRKIVMFTEQLGNFLLERFKGQRSHGETDSDVGLVEVKVKGFTTPLVERAAEAVGLAVDEVLAHLPDNLRLYIQPGGVDFSLGSMGLRQRLRPLHGYSPLHLGPADASTPRLNVATTEAAAPLTHPTHQFEASAHSDVKFTVASFATTRFGTAKQKSSLALMKQIQAKVMREEVTGGAPVPLPANFNTSCAIQEQENSIPPTPPPPPAGMIWNGKPQISITTSPTGSPFSPLLRPNLAFYPNAPNPSTQHANVWAPNPATLYPPPPPRFKPAHNGANTHNNAH